MRIITKSRLVKFWDKHPNSKTGLLLWFNLTTTSTWQNLVEVKKVFASADQVGNLTVFNIGGNKYRLIVFIDYTYQKVFIRHILTHADYDKERWKKDDWY